MKKILTIVIVVVALQLGVASVALASSGTYHKVVYGETLYGIARQYGSNPYAIAEANGLYNPDYIYAGQVLYIPAGGYGCNPCDNGWNQQPAKWHNNNQCNPCNDDGWGQRPAKWNNNQCNPCNDGGWNQNSGNNWNNNHCNPCNDGGWGQRPGNCNPCGQPEHHGWQNNNHKQQGGNYGYDYTGYYYSYGNQKYSHSCGYNANCW